MIVATKELYQKAKESGSAVGAFNTSTLEATKGIILAAQEANTSVVIETSPNEMKFIGAKVLVAVIKAFSGDLDVSVGIHLDHGKSLDEVKEAIDAGYTSVHIDGSSLSYAENVAVTKEVVEYAHAKGITVEGELGHIPGTSESHGEELKIDEDLLTDPELAKKFVAETCIDILASSIGNIHGVYKNEPNLDLDRLEKIGQIGIPLSLHGGSGIPEDQIKKAISVGITKINVNTELRLAYTNTLRKELLQNPDEIVPYKYLPEEIEAVKNVVKEKIEMFGCEVNQGK